MVGEAIAGTAGALGGGGLVVFMIKRLFRKVEMLDQSKASKASTDKRFDRIIETQETMRVMLSKQGEDIAHIKGTLDRGNR